MTNSITIVGRYSNENVSAQIGRVQTPKGVKFIALTNDGKSCLSRQVFVRKYSARRIIEKFFADNPVKRIPILTIVK